MGRGLAGAALVVFRLDPLAQPDIFRNAAGEGELGEFQRVGTVAGGLARRDQLVRRGDRVVDDGRQFEEHVLLHREHLRPVLDVRAVAEFDRRVGLAVAVEDAALVDAVVKGVRLVVVLILDVGGRRDDSAVGGRGRDRTGVHQADKGNLALARLRAFAVREVAGRVTDRKSVVGRHVAGSEARSAERRLDDDAGLEEFLRDVVAGGREIDRSRLRVGRHREIVVADGLALEDRCGLAEVVVGAAGAAGYEGLVSEGLAVLHLAFKVDRDLVAETLLGVFLDLLQDSDRVCLELVYRVGVGRVERKGDHRLLLREVDPDHRIVVGDLARLEFLVGIRTLVHVVVLLDLFIRDPDGTQAGGFGGHHVDSVTEVDRE